MLGPVVESGERTDFCGAFELSGEPNTIRMPPNFVTKARRASLRRGQSVSSQQGTRRRVSPGILGRSRG